MKKLNLLSSAIAILFIWGTSDCKQVTPEPKTELKKLPPATQQGKNTLGCLVNGKAMVPTSALDVVATYQSNWLQVHGAVEMNGSVQSISFFIDDANVTEKSYPLDNSSTQSGRYTYSDDKMRCNRWTDGSTDNTGVLTITKFDRVNLIVSGTFTFTVIPFDCPKYVITDGRFDLKFKP